MTTPSSLDPKAPYIGVRVDSDDARRIADLHSLLLDLRFVAAALAKIRALAGDRLIYCATSLLGMHERYAEWPPMLMADDGPLDVESSVVLQSLGESATARYMRCFAEGARERLDADLLFGDSTTVDRQSHELLKVLRDKHFSHPVNSFERVEVGVVIKREPRSVKLIRTSMAAWPFTVGNCAVFQRLVDICAKWCVGQVSGIESRIVDTVGQLTFEELSKLPHMEYTMADVYANPKKRSERLHR